MDTPEHSDSRRPNAPTSERTLRILAVVLKHPGRTVKQLRRIMADQGDLIADQTLRTHLKTLIATEWVRPDGLGRFAPGPAVAGGTAAIGRFQIVLALLRESTDGLSAEQLVKQTGMDLHAARAALTIGVQFNCIVHDGDGRYWLDADGLLLPPSTASDEDINTILKRFVEVSGHDAALARLTQQDGLIVSHLHRPPEGESLLTGVNSRAAHATAGGQAALSWLDHRQQRRYLAVHGMDAFTAATPTSVEALQPLLVSEPGHLYTAEGQYCETGACLAILVHNGPRTDDPIALTTSVHLRDLGRDRKILENDLRRAATELLAIIDGPLHPPEN
jgi:DNA-binding IclR family transcriptional regulator